MLSWDQHFLQTIYIIRVHLRVLVIAQVRFGPDRFGNVNIFRCSSARCSYYRRTQTKLSLSIDRIGEAGNNLISYARDYDVFGFLGLQLFIK